MRKSKRGPELFEVLSQGSAPDKQLQVPGWWSSRGRRPGRAESVEADSSRAPRDVAPARLGGDSDGTAAHAGGTHASAGSGGILELDGHHLRISLTSFSAAILIAMALMLLAVSFRIGQDRGYTAGRASYSSVVEDEIQRVRQGPPNRELLAGLQPSESGAKRQRSSRSSARFLVEPGASAPAGPAWVRGHTYITVQGFAAGSGDDAERVQAFLAEHGVDTAIILLKDGWRCVLTTQGYNHDDPAQKRLNEVLNRRVRSLGLVYREAGGRYNWNDTYFRKLEEDSW